MLFTGKMQEEQLFRLGLLWKASLRLSSEGAVKAVVDFLSRKGKGEHNRQKEKHRQAPRV